MPKDDAKFVTLPNGTKLELSLDNPLFADFDRVPATFDQFISDPYYLGKSWKNPWPFWKEKGEEFFPLPLRSPYSSLILLGATGIGKSCLNGTKVLTPDGYRPIEMLKVGDRVASNDGKFYPVTGVFPQGKKPCYEIEFGYDIKCTVSDNHIWTVSRDYGKTYHDETTKEIIAKGFSDYSVILPDTQPLPIEGFVAHSLEKGNEFHIHAITSVGEGECTCISIDAPSHLYIIEGGIPTHNTSFAVNMVMAYYLHVILCLKNPQEYFALEEQKNIVFAFINIVTKAIAYKNAWGMIHKALLKSPFFMEYGMQVGDKYPEWKCTKKPIDLLYGRNADDIIGLDILCCVTGDTAIKTSKGIERIESLAGKLVQVETFNPMTKQTELSQECKVIQTKFATELIEIELENGSKLRCTPEHRLLLKSGIYKRADELTEDDELQEV